MATSQVLESPEIEWLILADSAQVVNNKLYLLGGGWDVVNVGGLPPWDHHMAITAAIKVPWSRTSERHSFLLEMVTEDGKAIAQVGGEFEVGRPVGIVPGQPQRLQMALNARLKFERAGGYLVVAKIDGQEYQKAFFRVRASDVPRLPQPPSIQPSAPS